MIAVALATSSGSRLCAKCEEKIVNHTILIDEWHGHSFNHNLALCPKCARELADELNERAGIHN